MCMLLRIHIQAINQHILTYTRHYHIKLLYTILCYIQGHVHESMTLLQPYLPQVGGQTGSAYSEAGALYALGLIHANKGLI